MNSLPKRPKRGETEDDLLRLQKQFLADHGVEKPKTNSEPIGEHNERRSKNKTGIADNHDIPGIAVDIEAHIVTNIVERNADFDQKPIDFLDQYYHSSTASNSPLKHCSNGFPKAHRRSNNLVAKKGKSLFGQQLTKRCEVVSNEDTTEKKIIDKEEEEEPEIESGKELEEVPFNTREITLKPKTDVIHDSVVSGEGLRGFATTDWMTEINRIRNENESLVNKMSRTEIDELRNELKSKLSQKTIDFLRRRQSNKSECKAENKTNDIQMSDQVVEEIDVQQLPIKPRQVIENKWLNMNVIESDKLLWMRDIDENQTRLSERSDSTAEQTLNARFDFEANLIENRNNEIKVHTGLYHHKEDEASAGYTIQELYTLIQSTYNSQKVLALQVLSKLLTKAYNGLYDNCFSESLTEQLMKNSALVLVSRVCLDDTSETVWRAAIKAIHSMICNTIVDELLLDRGFVLFHHLPIDRREAHDLKPDYDSTKLEELSDEQLMKLDVINCLVKRTSILQRIRYLLETNKSHLDVSAVNDLLDILIRISRHSSESRHSIAKCPYLLDTIVNRFIPVSVTMAENLIDRPNPRALKLIRLLTENDLQTANEIVNTFPQLIEAIKCYLTLNPENCPKSQEVLRISIESLRVWITLLSKNVCVEEFWQMFPIVIKQLQYCCSLDPISHENQFDFQYASTLILAVELFVTQNGRESRQRNNPFTDLIQTMAMKWLTLIYNTVIVANFDANLSILSAVQFLLATHSCVQSLEKVIRKIIDSKALALKLTDCLLDNSNLVKLNREISGTARDSSNLPSFGAVYYQTLKTTPFLNQESSICFLLAVFRIMKSSSFISRANTSGDHLFGKLQCLCQYVGTITKNLKHNTRFNLFDLFELNFLAEICLLCCGITSKIGSDVAFVAPVPSATNNDLTRAVELCLNASIIIVNRVSNDSMKRSLITDVIFKQSADNFEISRNMSELCLDDKAFNSSAIQQSFSQIQGLYEKYSDFNCNHWAFDPLLGAIATNERPARTLTNQEVYDCLSFICILIRHHNNYFQQMLSSSSAFLCLIASVFLISENVFFEQPIEDVMKYLLKQLIHNKIVCKIQDRVPFFQTAGDFFVRLVDQFESSSYGNHLFANYLLLFCQSECSPELRNKLLCDHSSALRIIGLNFEQLLTPIDNFLFPIEADVSTLESYLRSLLSGALTPRESPVLYLMAVHHLHHALFGSEAESTANESIDRLIISVRRSSNQSVKQHLLNYSHFDPKVFNGISLNK